MWFCSLPTLSSVPQDFDNVRVLHPPPHAKQAHNTFLSKRTDGVIQIFVANCARRFRAYFDATNLQPSLPQAHLQDVSERRKLYQWSPGPESGPDYDEYPPHLSLIPKGSEDDLKQEQLFDRMHLLDSGFILSSIIPDKIKDFVCGSPDRGYSIAAVEARNHALRIAKKNIYADPNIGDRHDWFTDSVFAQQSFTGNNPATIELANEWTGKFKAVAKMQNNIVALRLLTSTEPDNIYVQDFSYLREAVGALPDTDLWVKGKNAGEDRFACASVCLFRLEPSGTLHPLAICIDYKGNIERSVTIFNKRLQSVDKGDQANDWPWRYAKTCVQASDWIRHEVIAHLNDTHFIEEAIIVAAYRNLSETHLVYRLLHPHWLKTLAINAGARATLVPHVITEIIGISVEQAYALLRNAYKRFDFTERYVPKDLENRGFPVAKLGSKKFHNYAYGRNIYLMWIVIREYVESFLRNGGQGFCSDKDVLEDNEIRQWCKEMRSPEGGQMNTFPDIMTFDQLVDVCTMCIHIASPQHTAVNYLQEYYQSFVLNKPPAMCSPLPASYENLKAYTEKDLLEALPINRAREWLLASHIPHLLSFRVADDQNLVSYAISQYHLADEQGEAGIREAARAFVARLRELGDTKDALGRDVPGAFSTISDERDDRSVPYKVMEPVATAVSILI